MTDFKIPEDVKFILDTLSVAGYEAWCVGGCVRDSLLLRTPTDYDIASSADPTAVISLFEKVIPTGIKHGTVTVVIDSVPYEVTKYRIDGEYTDHRRPDKVVFTDNFKEDLARRDFTVNAMGYNPDFGVFDPFGGIADLKNRIIRTVGNPIKRFSEDALRIMRAVRFSATLNFEIEQNTLNAIAKTAPTLENISAERILTELKKTLVSNNPDILSLIINNGGLEKYGFAKNTDLSVLKNTANIFTLRFAVLCVLFNTDINECCNLLRLSNKEKTEAKGYFAILSQKELLLENIKHYASDVGYENLSKAVLAYGALYGKNTKELARRTERSAKLCEPYCTKMLAVGGNDIKNMGISGKIIGDIQKEMLKEVLKNPQNNNKEFLLKIIKKYCR